MSRESDPRVPLLGGGGGGGESGVVTTTEPDSIVEAVGTNKELLKSLFDFLRKNGEQDERAAIAIILRNSTDLLAQYAYCEDGEERVLTAPLYAAVSAKRCKVVEEILKSRPGLVHQAREDGLTPLHAAALNGHAELIKILLANGARPNVTDTRGLFTPLFYAASRGDVESVKFLLAAGADVDGANKDNILFTPLHAAAYGGHAEVVKFLLVFGAEPIADEANAKYAKVLETLKRHAELPEEGRKAIYEAMKSDVKKRYAVTIGDKKSAGVEVVITSAVAIDGKERER